jgi:hypothetical protein
MKRAIVFFYVVLACVCSTCLRAQSVVAASGFPTTIAWPSDDNPTLKFFLAKLQPSGLYNGQSIFVCEVTVQNLKDDPLPKSVFTIFIHDKDNVRIGRSLLRLPEIPAKGSEKAQLQFSTAGVPAGAAVLVGRTVSLKVSSTPPGASLKVDGHDDGITPRVVDFTVGMHNIELSKEGYAIASSPLEVRGDEVEGGGISFELGGMSQDMLQLRDGTTLLGDVMSLTMSSVVIRVDGKDEKFDRNQVRKILLVERVTTAPATTGTTQKSK